MHLNKYIDHTLLKPTCLASQVKQLCYEAAQNQFASVCIPPPFIKFAKQELEKTDVKVATVIGFPFGYSAIEAKIAEIILALVDGADELDMVINLLALKNNDWQYLANEINNVMQIILQKKSIIKIIIESGVLTDEEIIKCCGLYSAAQVNFLKTSTGYAETGATIHAVELMKENLPTNVQIKAAGGIRTKAFAEALINAGASRIGCSNSIAIISEKNSKPY